jgi:GNAT superfamily N-acetyltransferase
MREHDTGPLVELIELTPNYAARHATRLAQLASHIPGSTWTSDMVLAEVAGGRPLLAKWQHSLVYADRGNPIAIAFGYETIDKDGIDQAIHLSALANDPQYRGQGYGRRLLQEFLAKGLQQGYQVLDSAGLVFSLQTGSGDGNAAVRDLYERHGFVTTGRVDKGAYVNVIMRADAAAVEEALIREAG